MRIRNPQGGIKPVFSSFILIFSILYVFLRALSSSGILEPSLIFKLTVPIYTIVAFQFLYTIKRKAFLGGKGVVDVIRNTLSFLIPLLIFIEYFLIQYSVFIPINSWVALLTLFAVTIGARILR